MTARPRTRPRRRLAGAAALVAAAALALAGCGGSSGSGGDSGNDAAAPEAASQPQGDAGTSAVQASPGGSAAAPEKREAVAGVAQSAVRRVRTAQVTVEVKSLPTAAAAVRQIATDLGGIVGSETTGYGAAASQPATSGQVPPTSAPNPTSAVVGEAVIVLRVPEPKLDQALLRLSEVGKELTRTSSAEDVSARLADLESRVATQRRSLERVRALLAQATSLQEIVTIEAELSRREADLESLQAQQRALGDQATLSTVTAILRLPDAQPSPAMPVEEDEAGFVAGLKDGWRALAVSTTVVLTVLGALLPPVVVLLVLGVPLWMLWRRFRPEPRPRPGRPPRPGAGPRPPVRPQPPAPATAGAGAPGPDAPPAGPPGP
jgi:hypothetical protein